LPRDIDSEKTPCVLCNTQPGVSKARFAETFVAQFLKAGALESAHPHRRSDPAFVREDCRPGSPESDRNQHVVVFPALPTVPGIAQRKKSYFGSPDPQWPTIDSVGKTALRRNEAEGVERP